MSDQHPDGTPSVVQRIDGLSRTVYVVVAFVAVLTVTVIIGIPQVLHSNSENAAQNACTARFADKLYAALDRRQKDSTAYQNADDRRDRVLVKLFAAKGEAEQQRWANEYLKATIAKQAALRKIKAGRLDKAYPEPPKVACP